MRFGVAVAVAFACVACAPELPTSADRARAADAADSAALARELAALPGAIRADVTLHRPVADPLAPGVAPASASATATIVVDDRADRAAVRAAAEHLLHAAAPSASASIALELGAPRPTLARVGPFTVESNNRNSLRATLAILAIALVLLASALAWRERPRTRSG